MRKQPIVQTGDGSYTFYSPDYDETYHSSSGALQEAFSKFCEPCKISELAQRGAINILDIGFGLGYNLLSALHMARRVNSACTIKITSLEKEVLSPQTLNSIIVPQEYSEDYELVKKAAYSLRYEENNIKIMLLEGDARKTIRKLINQYDAVFFDPFSVKKNPEMWSVEFFREIGKRKTDEARLATYSASTPVRCGLIEAGFMIGPAPGDGIKKEGTLASKKGDVGLFSNKILSRLKNSPERTPFYDPKLNFSHHEMFNYRKGIQQKESAYTPKA